MTTLSDIFTIILFMCFLINTFLLIVLTSKNRKLENACDLLIKALEKEIKKEKEDKKGDICI